FLEAKHFAIKAYVAVPDRDTVKIVISEEHAVRRAWAFVVGDFEGAGAQNRYARCGKVHDLRGSGDGNRLAEAAKNCSLSGYRTTRAHGHWAASGRAQIAEHGRVERHAAFTPRRGGLREGLGVHDRRLVFLLGRLAQIAGRHDRERTGGGGAGVA